MPLTAKGSTIKSAMEREYGANGERVFYASKNAGTITGVDMDERKDAGPAEKLATVVAVGGEWFWRKPNDSLRYGPFKSASAAASAARDAGFHLDAKQDADSPSRLDAAVAACDALVARVDAMCARVDAERSVSEMKKDLADLREQLSDAISDGRPSTAENLRRDIRELEQKIKTTRSDAAEVYVRAYPSYTTRELEEWLLRPNLDSTTRAKTLREIEARKSGESKHKVTPQVESGFRPVTKIGRM